MKIPDLFGPLEEKRKFEDDLKKNRFNKKDLSFEKEKSQFRWYSDQSVKSHHNKDIMFTNFVPKRLDSETDLRINEICQSLACLDNKQINQVTNVESNERLKSICRYYLEDNINPKYCDYVYKVNFSDYFGITTPFRIFILFEADGLSNRYYKSILFLDPYHLVISSKHNGNSKEETLKQTYKKNRNNGICLSKLIEV